MIPCALAFLCLLAAASDSFLHAAPANGDTLRVTSLSLMDQARQRPIPVELYTSTAPKEAPHPRLAILSHGYGLRNTEYRFIASQMVAQGYAVASIQHEIPGDPPLPKTGKPYETRLPSWQQGVQNIVFVLAELKKTHSEFDFEHAILIGHSHGGDTSMLFAQEHPDLVEAVISLDNRRMPFPRIAHPRLFSIRSSDHPAGDGALPSEQEQRRFNITIVRLANTHHDDMWDGGAETDKTAIRQALSQFLAKLR